MYLALVLSAEMLSIDSVARWFENDMTMGDFLKTPKKVIIMIKCRQSDVMTSKCRHYDVLG